MKDTRKPRTADGERRKDKTLGVPPALRRYAKRYGQTAAGIIALDARLKRA